MTSANAVFLGGSMDIEKAVELMKQRHNQKVSIRLSKAHDYANVDCLSNFKVMAALESALRQHGLTVPTDRPAGVALWHLLHKFTRILNLLSKGEKAKNESIEDSFTDLEVYSQLALECLKDEGVT